VSSCQKNQEGDAYLIKDGKRVCKALLSDAALVRYCGTNELCKWRWLNQCPLCDKGPFSATRRQLRPIFSPGKCSASAKFDPSIAQPYFKLASFPYFQDDANLECFYNTVTDGDDEVEGTASAQDPGLVNAQDQQNHVFGIAQQLFDLNNAVEKLASAGAVESFIDI
jgi:hypothetical protein